ncbi:MAG: DUF4867 family protein [Lachnospiraceae bacterium]|nr:DUF4867 family protein [Lachnospiraceae bacterium]
MKVLKVTDPEFRKYGKVVKNVDLKPLIEAMAATPCPDDTVYVAGDPALEAVSTSKDLQRIYYGELPIQVGYCNGHNQKLNAVEYHRCSELNIAATDAILILGCQQDIADDYTYDTSKMEAFFLPAGCGVEIYGTTLHYAPCGVDGKGFRVTIVLPLGTNAPLKEAHEAKNPSVCDNEDRLLAAENKWLIAHKDGGQAEGSFLGLKGENLTV